MEQQPEQQPPEKKIATDGETGVALTNSSPSHGEGMPEIQASSADTVMDPSSSEIQINEAMSDVGDKSEKQKSKALKTSAALDQVWKNELNSGRMLMSLHDLFGEGILSFIPSPEMYLIL